jgi:hypothetical protein
MADEEGRVAMVKGLMRLAVQLGPGLQNCPLGARRLVLYRAMDCGVWCLEFGVHGRYPLFCSLF